MSFERVVVTPEKWQRAKDDGSPAVRAGDLLFIASQHAVDPNSKTPPATNAGAQAKVALERIRQIVTAAGGTMDDIVDVVAFFLDIRDAEDVLEVSREFFTKDYPAWTFMGTQGLPQRGSVVQIHAVAHLGKPGNNVLRRRVWAGGANIPFQAPAAKANTCSSPDRWRLTLMATSPTRVTTRPSPAISSIGSKN